MPLQYSDAMGQTQLTEWMAGFFDGEGLVNAGVAKSGKPAIGYHIAPQVKLAHSYVGGLFDAEGSLYLRISEGETWALGYASQPIARIEMHENDPLIERIQAYANAVGCDGSIHHVDRSEDNDNRDDTFCWVASSFDDVERFCEGIRDEVVVKKAQIDIMLDEIIPMLRAGEHTRRRGFLKVMAWRDIMNSYKGGKRGKYDLEYFEELWGMSIQDRHLPKCHPRRLGGDI